MLVKFEQNRMVRNIESTRNLLLKNKKKTNKQTNKERKKENTFFKPFLTKR